MFKNVASQKIAVFAYDTAAGAGKTGDASNITAQISIDGAATAATNDTNPTELDATDAPGIYIFDTTQAESNGDLIILSAVSATSGITIEPVFIYTIIGAAGAGAITWTYTLTDSVAPNNPIADADIWVTSDIGGNNVIASGTTDQNGVVTFYLDAGTVYVWGQKSGWDFDNPDTETVS